MIIKSSRANTRIRKVEPKTPPLQNSVVPAPEARKSEKPQPKKSEVKKPKIEIKPEVKAESQVEIKKEEIIEVPKKRSLLEEVLEEQAKLED